MNREKVLGVILQKIRGEEGDIIPVLRTVPIFEGLSFRDLKKIELIVHERTFMPDETIFHERQPGAGMYIIKKGLIKLTKTVNEEKVKIGELRDGEFLERCHYSMTIHALLRLQRLKKQRRSGYLDPTCLIC